MSAVPSADIGAAGAALFRLSAGAELLRVGKRMALFSAGAERLYELNETAVFLASTLRDGASLGTLVAALEAGGFDGRTARPLVIDLLRQWSRHKIVEADIQPTDTPLLWSQPLHIAAVDARISYSSLALHARASPVFSHLAARSSPSVSALATIDLIEDDGMAFLRMNQGPATVIESREAAPDIKAFLVEQVLAKAPPSIALHTACLARQDGALLLSGPPGAGKSTLTVALSHSGFRYVSDDITLLRPDGLVEGVPFAPGLKKGAWPLLRRFRPDLEDLPIHVRADGLEVRYLTLPVAPRVYEMRAKRIVHLRRTPGSAPEFRELEPADALARLTSEAHSAAGAATLRDMRALIALVERAKCYEFVYSDLDEAVQGLNATCAEN